MGNKSSDIMQRQEIDFLRHHEFNEHQHNATINTLQLNNIPKSICDEIISFLDGTYLRSYCKVSLSFESKSNNIFHDFKFPQWIHPEIGQGSQWTWGNFTIIPYPMGTFNSLNRLDHWPRGSSWRLNWGNNCEYDAVWKCHQYKNNNKIHKFKKTNPLQYEKNTTIKFCMMKHTFFDEKYIFQIGKREFRGHGNVCVLCVDYTAQNSLKYAERYAQTITTNFNLLSFAVVNCDSELDEYMDDKSENDKFKQMIENGNKNDTQKHYFSWKDVIELAKKYDASCFELSKHNDDNLMFVYNQLVYEWAYWHHLHPNKK